MCLVCVFLMIKKADNVLNNNFLIRFLSLLYSFSSVFIPFSSVFSLPSEQKTKKPNSRRPHLHWRQRRSTARLRGRRISSPPSTFEDPARDRAFLAADPSLQDPGLNLTFTFFVNGFWSKEWRVPQTEKFVFWFLFFIFFFLTNRENPFSFSLFAVEMELWFTIQTYTLYILEI